MLGIEHYAVFIMSGLLLNVTPGSDTIYILTRTISQGRKAGFASVLGIVTGALFHTAFAALGLSVILMKSAVAFQILKWLGAGYLIYLGIKAIAAKSQDGLAVERGDMQPLRRVYTQGLLTNLLNPKVALFYLAFLPQFIQADNDYGVLPFLILGLTFIVNGTVWCFILVLIADLATRKLRSSKITRYLDKATGAVYVLLGLKLLRTGQTNG